MEKLLKLKLRQSLWSKQRMMKNGRSIYRGQKISRHVYTHVGTIHGDSQVESRDKPVVNLKNGYGQGVVGSLGLSVEANKEAVKVFDSGEASSCQKKRTSHFKYSVTCKDVDRLVKEISENVNFVEPARKQGGDFTREEGTGGRSIYEQMTYHRDFSYQNLPLSYF